MGGRLISGKWSLVTSRDSVCPLETKVAEYGDNLANVFRASASKHEVPIVHPGLECVSAAGVGHLCILKTTANAPVYQDVLDHFLIPYIENKFENGQVPARSRFTIFSQINHQVVQEKEYLCLGLAYQQPRH